MALALATEERLRGEAADPVARRLSAHVVVDIVARRPRETTVGRDPHRDGTLLKFGVVEPRGDDGRR